MYKTVYDLTPDEFRELKETLFSELVDSGEIEEVAPDAEYFWDLPDSLVESHYDGISFVEDDFFCNQAE